MPIRAASLSAPKMYSNNIWIANNFSTYLPSRMFKPIVHRWPNLTVRHVLSTGYIDAPNNAHLRVPLFQLNDALEHWLCASTYTMAVKQSAITINPKVIFHRFNKQPARCDINIDGKKLKYAAQHTNQITCTTLELYGNLSHTLQF